MADFTRRQSRRQFIGAVGSVAASSILAHGCASDPKAEVARPAPILDPTDRPEVNTIRLGYIALTDAAPIMVAQEKATSTNTA